MNGNYSASFFEVIQGSGAVGIIIWIWILLFSLLGLWLGSLSVITSLNLNKNRYPIALKLLICCCIATLLAGADCTVTGYVDTFAMLGSTTGAAKPAAFKLGAAMARVGLYFSAVSTLIQILFVVASLLIIEHRAEQKSFPELTFAYRIKQIPIAAYAAALLLIPASLGIVISFLGIEQLVLLKPGNVLLDVLGFSFIPFMQLLFICAALGFFIQLFLILQLTVKGILRALRRTSL